MTEQQRVALRDLRRKHRFTRRALQRASDWLDRWPHHTYDGKRALGKCTLCDTIDQIAAVLRED